jgi:hypothetical protein
LDRSAAADRVEAIAVAATDEEDRKQPLEVK